jgi:hypothetical protein
MAHSLKTDEDKLILPCPFKKMTTQDEEENIVFLVTIDSA